MTIKNYPVAFKSYARRIKELNETIYFSGIKKSYLADSVGISESNLQRILSFKYIPNALLLSALWCVIDDYAKTLC